MHPILFKIGTFTFYTHGFLAVTGIVVGSYVTYLLAKRRNLNTDFLFDILVYTVLAGIIGARLSYYFIYTDQFVNWKEIFFLWQGGMVSYGGFLLGGLAFAALIAWQKMLIKPWLDAIVPGFFLGLFFGRIGNIMAGEYNGTLVYHNINFPVIGLEAILCLVIFALGYNYFQKVVDKSDGAMAFLSLSSYGLIRLAIDFLRPEAKIWYNLSLGQYFDILTFIVFLIILLLNGKRKDKYGI